MEAAEEAGLLDELHAALDGAQIVARGPKARGAIQQAGLTADWVAESETSTELGEYLLAEGVDGRRIAVQHHGSGADGLDELFEGHGADVVSLTVYRWGPPPDAEAVRRSVVAAAAGEVDAVLFTSARAPRSGSPRHDARACSTSIRSLVEHERVLMAAVGPITAGPLERAGLAPLIAERGRLGSLVRTVVTHFGGGHAPSQDTAAGRRRAAERRRRARRAVHPPLADRDRAARRRCSMPRGASSRGQRSSPRSPARATTPTRSRWPSPACGRRSACPDLIKTVVKRGYRLNVLDPGGEPVTRPTLIACSHGTAYEDGRRAIAGIVAHVRAILPDVPVEEAFVDVQTPRRSPSVVGGSEPPAPPSSYPSCCRQETTRGSTSRGR